MSAVCFHFSSSESKNLNEGSGGGTVEGQFTRITKKKREEKRGRQLRQVPSGTSLLRTDVFWGGVRRASETTGTIIVGGVLLYRKTKIPFAARQKSCDGQALEERTTCRVGGCGRFSGETCPVRITRRTGPLNSGFYERRSELENRSPDVYIIPPVAPSFIICGGYGNFSRRD